MRSDMVWHSTIEEAKHNRQRATHLLHSPLLFNPIKFNAQVWFSVG